MSIRTDRDLRGVCSSNCEVPDWKTSHRCLRAGRENVSQTAFSRRAPSPEETEDIVYDGRCPALFQVLYARGLAARMSSALIQSRLLAAVLGASAQVAHQCGR